jgi:hypothetical protein
MKDGWGKVESTHLCRIVLVSFGFVRRKRRKKFNIRNTDKDEVKAGL